MMNINGQTNITDLRIGRDTLNGLGKEIGKFVVTTMPIPWKFSKEKLRGNPEKVVMVETMEESWLDKMLESLPDCDTVVGIGGGQAIDAAKYISLKRGIRLVSIPTILSVDAFVTPAAGIRRNHQVFYVGNSSPNPLVIDFNLLRTAPKELNVAGIGDLLSIHTGTFDWEYAQSKGKSEFPFSAGDVAAGRNILDKIFLKLDDIRENTDEGLTAIVEGYITMNTICLPAGHYRIEEGSEHFLFYELEERLARPFVHGYIVGLGIYLMSQLQQNRFEMIKEVMNRVGLKYHPSDMGIEKEDLIASLLNVKNYVQSKPNIWYSVIDDSNITLEWALNAVNDLKF
ncbi:MAG: iron-containing alcohol dehydrogenase [Bacteroidales bacterium]